MAEKHRCCAEVWPKGGYHPGRCERMASVERDGRHYCKQHDPVAVKARDDERNAKWEAKWCLARAKTTYANAAVALAEADIVTPCVTWPAYCVLLDDFRSSKAALDAAKKGGA